MAGDVLWFRDRREIEVIWMGSLLDSATSSSESLGCSTV